MANRKISQLTNSLTKATVDSADLLPVVDTSASETKKMTYQELIQPTDANFRIAGSADNTKLVAFEVDGLTTATTRTITIPDANTTMVGTDTTQTLSNKTLTAPQVNMGSDATGDMYYRNGSATTTRLPIGTSGQILQTSAGGIPEWIANPAVTAATSSAAGIVELATTAETETGTDATRAVTPDGLHDMTTLAGAGWFLDEDTMASNSATKTVSQQSVKAYVDEKLKHTSNAYPTDTSGYFTWQANIMSTDDGGTKEWLGWTGGGGFATPSSGSEAYNGAGAALQLSTASTGATSSLYSYLPCLNTLGSALNFSHIGTNYIYLKTRFNFDVAPTGLVSSWGLSDAASGFVQAYNGSTRSSIRFVYDKATAKMYAVSAKAGVGVTNTDVTSYWTTGVWNIFEIVFNSAEHLFYINGVLVATHTTNLETQNVPINLGWGETHSVGTSNMMVAPITISMPNAAS